jgi:PGF-pre-PGF domain-containing protein
VKKGVNKKKGLILSSVFVLLILVAVLVFFLLPTTGGEYVKWGNGPYYYNCSTCSECNNASIDANPGDTIFLNTTINSSSVSCINIINKSNIIFDCQNYVINGSYNLANINGMGVGILLMYSNNSQIKNCNLSNFFYGISLNYSTNNTLTNITVSRNYYGISLLSAAQNNISNSHIENNSNYGLFAVSSSNNNSFYNNYFNNTRNYFIFSSYNFFNITKTFAKNIIGGDYIGGNFWGTPSDTGFSQNCTDIDNDKICDVPYNLTLNNNTDYLPLNLSVIPTIPCVENNQTCTPWTICQNGMQTRNCTDSNSCGTITYQPTQSQSCNMTTGNGNWCYQESANVSTDCGGLDTGVYLTTGLWGGGGEGNNPQYGYDKNWNTFSSSNGYTSYMYVNYTVPTLALSSSLWQVKGTSGMFNFSLANAGCWNETKLQLRAASAAATSIAWSCFPNGVNITWYTFSSVRATPYGIYEEAMIWNMSPITTAATTPANITTATTIPTSPSVSTGGNAGGGGGGGGGSGGSGVSGVEGIGTKTTKSLSQIVPNQPAEIEVNNPQIYLTKMQLNVLESVKSVSVTVTKVNAVEDANLKIGLPTGQFYQSFQVQTSGTNNSNIANVTLEFKVNKEWLTSQNGTINSVGLFRKQDISSSWNSLITTYEKSDDTFYYFTSVSPGFSTFAVFFNTCEGTQCGNVTSSNFWIYAIIILAIIILLVLSFIIFKKFKKKVI